MAPHHTTPNTPQPAAILVWILSGGAHWLVLIVGVCLFLQGGSKSTRLKRVRAMCGTHPNIVRYGFARLLAGVNPPQPAVVRTIQPEKDSDQLALEDKCVRRRTRLQLPPASPYANTDKLTAPRPPRPTPQENCPGEGRRRAGPRPAEARPAARRAAGGGGGLGA